MAVGGNHYSIHSTYHCSLLSIALIRIALKESEKLWQFLLQRDFGIDAAIRKEPGWNVVLNIKFPTPQATPIFGVDPAADDFLLTIEGAFEVWKYWLKADSRVLPQHKKDTVRSSYGTTFIYVPYFLRAAHFWKTIFRWCDADQVTEVGEKVRKSFGSAFDAFSASRKWLVDSPLEGSSFPKTSCRMALLAIYSFSSGQGRGFRPSAPFIGLLGGYHAYNYYSSMNLTAPILEVLTSGKLVIEVAKDVIGYRQGLGKAVYVECDTGKVLSERRQDEPGGLRLCYSSTQTNPHDQDSIDSPCEDDFLRYLEEYARRLSIGLYGVGTLGTLPDQPKAITLFPQLRNNQTPNEGIVSLALNTPVVSRAVTRGIEVMGSAVFAREAVDQMGFIYCIRCRILQPHEEGYQPVEERGFKTCQLYTRHWRITNNDTGQTSSVDGEGVIGMYPVLNERGYEIAGDSFPGTFQYQSCTGEMGSTGSFAGEIEFIPGSIQYPTGEPFRTALSPFRLDSRPNFLY